MKFCYSFSWDAFIAFLNSQFFSSMAGALAGAFAGAIVAHRISTNARLREEIEDQVRATNAAITAAFLICNSLLSIKKQQVAKMHGDFQKDKARFESSLLAPAGTGTHHFDMDLEFMSLPPVPIEALTKQAYERLNLKGRPLALVASLSSTLVLLQTRVEFRNALINRYRVLFPTLPEIEKLKTYFGLPLAGGSVSKEYSDSVEGIHSYTDDVIYFSSLLVSDLVAHGEALRARYIKRFGANIDKISRMSFDNPEAKALMPNPENYKDWQAMFGSFPEEPKKSWLRAFGCRSPNHSLQARRP